MPHQNRGACGYLPHVPDIRRPAKRCRSCLPRLEIDPGPDGINRPDRSLIFVKAPVLHLQLKRMLMTRSPAPTDLILPPIDTKRWSPSRKAAVVAATRAGVISRDEACERYSLSEEELIAWEQALDQNGVPGLRTTRLQCYRGTQRPQSPRPRPRPYPDFDQQQVRFR